MELTEKPKETIKPQGTTKSSAAAVSKTLTKNITKTSDVKDLKKMAPPANTPNAPAFANKAQLDAVSSELLSSITGGRAESKPKGAKAIPHIRCWSMTTVDLIKTLKSKGFVQTDKFPQQVNLSGKFQSNIFSFEKNNVIYSFVVSTTGKASVAAKEFTPVNLGLAGKQMKRAELIKAAKSALEKKQMDDNVKQAMLMLIDIAAARGAGQLTPELNDAISEVRNIISVDFGEILAPIMIMTDKDVAEFPVGNAPLIDVRVGSQNISVKSLSGSGTSFKSVSELMDQFETSIDPSDEEAKRRFNILRKFHPSNKGSNKDKIIAATAEANTPEYKKLCSVLKVSKIDSFKSLTTATHKMHNYDYTTFLKKVFPVMTAGNWDKPVGLPADGASYLGLKIDKPVKAKKAEDPNKVKKVNVAGRVSYDRNRINGGADILTYVMGVGLLNFITRGPEAEAYSSMMTDIVNKANAVIGKIDITLAGGLTVQTKPFADLQFRFQYHAPSHIPGNNLPGFIAILN